MFFRNLFLFRIFPDMVEDIKRLEHVLDEHPLREVGPLELGTSGFVPPVGRDDEGYLTFNVGDCILLCFGRNEKLLPAAVVNDELQRRVHKIAEQEGRKVGGRERKRIKEDLLTELLPRAFVRKSTAMAYIDLKHHWLVIDTSSRKSAENVVSAIREALGSFPALPLAPEESPRVLMTDWLGNGSFPAEFKLGSECELRDPATSTGAKAKCTRQDLDSEEVKEHLRNGKQVFQLGLLFNERIDFVLGEDLAIRKLRFTDVVWDEWDANAKDDDAPLIDAQYALMTLELRQLLGALDKLFGLHPDAPLRMHKQDAPEGMREAVRNLDRLASQDGGAQLEDNQGNVLATFGDRNEKAPGDVRKRAVSPVPS